jgi:acyl-CoA synthetase (AMP-forming)/AMP-acid ligase II
MNVGSLLERHARYRPDHLAVVCGEHRLTFRDLEQRVNRVCHALLDLGLRKGDSLAIILPNCVELLEVYRAAARLGIVAVPLSPLLRGAGLVSLLRDSDTVAVLSSSALVPALDEARRELPGIPEGCWLLTGAPDIPGYVDFASLTARASDAPPPPVEIGDRDFYNIIYSSGTTGEPKGIVHDHYVRGMYCTLFASQFRVTPESVVLHAGSLVFNGAFVTLMPAWFLGCTYVLLERFDAEAFIETVHREQVTHVMMVPSQIVAVMNAPNFSAEKLRSLRMLCSVGAPWHREHKERLLPMLRGALYELYGLTEGVVTVLDSSEFEAHIDSVGTPVVFTEMRIVDADGRELPPGEVGEIVGRSPLLMPGYYKRPDLTAGAIIDGWLHTGDLGRFDIDGYLHLVDRKKDLIISGGVNVYPKDIEEVAVQHPAVREVAVFGIPDAKWGEVPVAAVILKQPGAIGDGELREWINARVAARYQQVSRVMALEDFPRSTAGKTLKRVLRERVVSTTAPADVPAATIA